MRYNVVLLIYPTHIQIHIGQQVQIGVPVIQQHPFSQQQLQTQKKMSKRESIVKELLKLKSKKVISINDKYRIQKLQQLLDKEI